ncbi:MAG: group II intron reverse transcriptase/maturase [Nitrososphaera sp.]|nr:group II intron reverse transcriptase/maturase [Nitrososphaera sp.]
MVAKRQKTQMELAFDLKGVSEANEVKSEGIEADMAKRREESSAIGEQLMEEVCEAGNCQQALKQVKANRGSAGVDGMTVDELPRYLTEHWPEIENQLLTGTYKPQPVKRVEIPKPDGGKRQLGIPTVVDRFVQQAVLQVLQGRWDGTFSEFSYGFRPNRSAHQAVGQAQSYIAEGYGWVVDIDLEKFFDRVNHDKLMGAIAKRVKDKRMLKLIRAFLNSGVMENGLVSPIDEGTPQGGPLSPLLSNIVLDELDQELVKRGHRFVRYADDCNIYVRSQRAGDRVMGSVKRFIEKKLKLKVNDSKSAVARPAERKFLGFSFFWRSGPRRRIAPKAIERFKERIRVITQRTRGVSMERRISELSSYLKGWRGYFSFCETPTVLTSLEEWVRRRLRSVYWKQWKKSRRRFAELRKRGVTGELVAKTVGSCHGPWRLSKSPALSIALPIKYFDWLGVPRLAVRK